MPKKTLIDDTIGWVNYVQDTVDKKQPAAIDWRAEYQKKDEMYKELARIIAKKNCDYHSLKAKFLRMREECGAEKKRADTAELIIEGLQSEEWQKTCQYCEGTKSKIDMCRKGYDLMKARVTEAEEREQQLNEFVQKVLAAEDISFLHEGHIRWKDQAKRTLEQVYGADGE